MSNHCLQIREGTLRVHLGLQPAKHAQADNRRVDLCCHCPLLRVVQLFGTTAQEIRIHGFQAPRVDDLGAYCYLGTLAGECRCPVPHQ